MIKILEQEVILKCTGCHACYAVCPKKCISMKADGEGFLYPEIDVENCINCRMCEQICPLIHTVPIHERAVSYAAVNKKTETRMQSSSGGVFTLLAEYVMNQGGVVFGAKFDCRLQIVHGFTETKDGIADFQGSKYVQSKIGNAYLQAKQFLDAGRMVLFTGTPCQISGLKAFLKKEYQNLICQDIICHGVPSPLVWAKYKEYQEQSAKAAAEAVFFREKTPGWKKFSIKFQFHNHTEYMEDLSKDFFMRGFLSNLYLRPSCYQCKFKGYERYGDITLADFWGIQNLLPQMDDDKGTSLVLVNSPKGNLVWDRIKENLEEQEVDLNKCLEYNSAAISSAKINTDRSAFFKLLRKNETEKAFKKYCKKSKMNKWKDFFCVHLKKIGSLVRR